MAQVAGPLFSQQAKGPLFKALTYSQRLGKKQVGPIIAPSYRRTVAQDLQRTKFADGIAAWTALPQVEKDAYKESAKEWNHQHNDPFGPGADRTARDMFMSLYLTNQL